MQQERLPLELPAIQAKYFFAEANGAARRLQIPHQAALRAVLPIVEVPLGGVADIRPGNDLPGYHCLCIRSDAIS